MPTSAFLLAGFRSSVARKSLHRSRAAPARFAGSAASRVPRHPRRDISRNDRRTPFRPPRWHLVDPPQDSPVVDPLPVRASTSYHPLPCRSAPLQAPQPLLLSTSSFPASHALLLPAPPTSEDLLDLVRHLEPPQHTHAVRVQPKRRFKSDGRSFRNVELDHRCQILRGLLPSKTVGRTQAAVHLHPRLEIFSAKDALLVSSGQRQWPGYSQRIPKLPRFALVQRFLRNEIFRDVPPVRVAGENQLQFQRPLRISSSLCIS